MDRGTKSTRYIFPAVLILSLGTLIPNVALAGITFTGGVSPAASSSWNSATDGYVGYNGGPGTAFINGGSNLASKNGYIGDFNYGEYATNGTVSVDGIGSTWTNSANLYLGTGGNGMLNITGGAAVSNMQGYIGYNGEFGGGVGVVVVSGNSTWTNSEELYVGFGLNPNTGGSGSLEIRSGGTVTSSGTGEDDIRTSYVGYRGAAGTVLVEGAGSTWLQVGYLEIGHQTTGTLDIHNGGHVEVTEQTQVAGWGIPGSSINFSGGTLTTHGLIARPTELTGVGTIDTYGLVSDINLTFDIDAFAITAFGTAGTMTVDMSATSGNGDLGVGYESNATLLVCNGATIHSANGILGYRAGATGAATVNAAAWNMSGNLIVGNMGAGTLLIENGGNVTNTNANGYIGGFNSDAAGTVTVDGAGSTWDVTGYYNAEWDSYVGGTIYVGYNMNGAGTLNITNDAVVNSVNGYIAGDPTMYGMGLSGSVKVSDATWNIDGKLSIGSDGNGELNIQSGGSVSVGGATVMAYGTAKGNSGCTGAINFSGGTLSTQSLYTSPSQLTGTGTISTHGLVSDQASLTLDAATLTFSINDNVSVTINVGDSSNRGDLGAGYLGTGSLGIANGVNAYSAAGYVGYGIGSSGTVSVTGAGSTWDNASDLYLGYMNYGNTAGVLKVDNGGAVHTEGFYIGHGRDGGAGTLEIINGGSVSSSTSYIGYQLSSTGTATVAGSGSTWTNSGVLYVGGYRGTGILNVSGGGTVLAAGGIAAGSRGNGTLNLMADGTVLANSLTGANYSSSVVEYNFDGGTLKAYSAANSTWIAPGTAGTTSVLIKQGGANFDTNGYDMVITMALQHDGASTDGGVTKLGIGTLTLSGDNNFTGATTIKAGALKLVGTDIMSSGAWDTVLNHGGADLQGGKLVFNYTGVTPADTIATILNNSFGTANPFSQGNGAQIYSTTAMADGMALGWIDNGIDEVTVMYTLYGDSNLDGSVNGTDLNAVLSYYNQSSQVWTNGDFNYDGSVNGTDLNTVLSNYNQSLSSSTAAVPEPSTLLLATVALLGLLTWRKRLMVKH